jgi:hypothetical protein
MQSRLTYLNYYKLFGIRHLAEVGKPRTRSIRDFQLPLGSVYHYAAFDGLAMGPLPDDPAFAYIDTPVQIWNEHTLAALTGNPRKENDMFNSLVQQLRARNRRLKVMRNDTEISKDTRTLTVYNYAILARLYRYTRSAYADYYRWGNIWQTVVQRMAQTAAITDRQQFYIAGVPQLLPGKLQLDQCDQGVPASLFKIINSPAAFLLVEMWNWLSENRSNSVLGQIPDDKLQYINIVYQESGQWSVINLGYLDQLRQDPQNPDKKKAPGVAPTDQPTPMPAQSVQKRFLLLMMKLTEARTLGIGSDDGTDASTQDEIDGENAPVVSKPLSGQGPDITQDPGVGLELPTLSDVEDDSDQKEITEQERKQEDTLIEEQIARLNQISSERTQDVPRVSYTEYITRPAKDPQQAFLSRLEAHAQHSSLSAAEYNRYKVIGEKYKSIPAPGGEGTLDKFTIIDHSKIKIDADKSVYVDHPAVLDKTMLRSTIEQLDENFISHALPRHIAGNVTALQNAGVAISEYEVETVSDVLGDYQTHTVRVIPIEGAPSTLTFKVPVLDKDGTFMANGTRYRYRRQFSDRPIRKISDCEVALTSYYGKTFVERGRKAADSVDVYIKNKILSTQYGQDDTQAKVIEDMKLVNVFDNTFKLPRLYSAIAMNFSEITVKGVKFVFDRRYVMEKFDASVRSLETHDTIAIGYSEQRAYLLDNFGQVHAVDRKDIKKPPTPMGHLLDLLGIDAADLPVEYAELKVFSKYIPVVYYLAYHHGLDTLLGMLNVTPQRVPVGTRVKYDAMTQYAVAFSDETWVLDKGDAYSSMILGGLNAYAKVIKQYPAHTFDSKGVYFNVMESQGLGVRYLREMEMLDLLFIDHITLEVLKTIKEPQTFDGLVLRACELLVTDDHPDELDIAAMRIKSSELIAGAVYTELANAVRAHHATPGKATKKIAMNPYAVWKRISDDPVKIQLTEMNPIKYVEEMSSATFSGTQGRSSRSMVKSTRAFHPSHQGVVSEGTTDSSDVAINVLLTPNAKFENAYGMTGAYDYKQDGMTSTISASALMSAYADTDDMRRVGFISIQTAHTIACEGYHQASLRTGYDSILGQRTSDMYCITAKQPGVCTEINDHGVIVTWADGTVQGYSTDTQYGKAAGLVVPHVIKSPLKQGQKINPGEAVIYNVGFFEPDFFDPKRVVARTAVNLRTVLWENNGTLEDASGISSKAAERLSTKMTKLKTIVVPFSTAVTMRVNKGASVEYDTTLCVLQDEISANAGAFNDNTMDNLARLSSQSPRAGTQGVIDKIEYFYHGEIEDMHLSLQQLCSGSDKALVKAAKALGRKAYTGSVDSGFRNDGEPLPFQHVAIRVYITSTVTAAVGDKGVFGHQLKSVFSSVNEEPYVSEDGQEIDAEYGSQSVKNRIVNSSYILGTTIGALVAIEKAMVDAYRGK